MNKSLSLLTGITLVLIGVIALMFTFVAPVLGLHVWRLGVWRLWPWLVVGAGLLCALPPFLVRRQPGWGILFIVGLPILATGGILLFTSVFNVWGAWAWLWPLELLALAAGFLFAALYARSIWLIIPAIIIGLNGLVMQGCAITGLWSAWAVLWTVEPLSVGLSLLVASAPTRSSGLFVAGLILCGLAGLGLVGMSSIVFARWWPIRLMGPLVLILVGGLLLAWGMLRRTPLPKSPIPEGGNGGQS